MKKARFTVDAEVYNVAARMADSGGPGYDDNPDWWEYEVRLLDSDGDVVDEWDSLSETYNGVQQLTQSNAKKAVAEIAADVKAGKASLWFSRVPAQAPSRAVTKKPRAKSKSKSRTAARGTTLGGVR